MQKCRSNRISEIVAKLDIACAPATVSTQDKGERIIIKHYLCVGKGRLGTYCFEQFCFINRYKPPYYKYFRCFLM